MSKNNFTSHMDAISNFLKPDPKSGVTSISYFNNKVLEFSESRGVKLKENFMTNNESFEKNKDFIKRALVKDKPLAFIMLNNNVLKEFEWHWMTVTKLFEIEDRTYLNFSSWGERRVFKLEDVYNYSSFCAFSYFDF